jgi:hypothetical protein
MQVQSKDHSNTEQLRQMQHQVQDLQKALALEKSRTRAAQHAYVAALRDRCGVRAVLHQLVADVTQQEDMAHQAAKSDLHGWAPRARPHSAHAMPPVKSSQPAKPVAAASALDLGRLQPRSVTHRRPSATATVEHRKDRACLQPSRLHASHGADADSVLSAGVRHTGWHSYSALTRSERAALLQVSLSPR